jgi:hypothetical protein
VGYGLGIDVGTRTVVTVIRQGNDQRVLSQVINPPVGPTPAADAERHAFAIRRALQAAAEVTGAAPDTVALTYPAGAGPYGFNLVRRAAELARLDAAHLVSDMEAAVSHQVGLGEWDNGELLACVDLGDIDYGRPGEHDADGDEVTVAVLRVSASAARLVGQARALPVEQSAPAMHAAVNRALRSLLASAGLEPGRLSGLLLVGEAVLAPGATGRLAERLVEHLGPDLGTTSKVVTAPAQAAALGAVAIAASPEVTEPDEDVYGVVAVPGEPPRPGKLPVLGFPALPARPVRTAAAPKLGFRWLGAIAAALAAVAVGAGAFVVTDTGRPGSESSPPSAGQALHWPAPVTTEETTAAAISATTSSRPVARKAERPRTPATSTSTVHGSVSKTRTFDRTSKPAAPSRTTAGVPAPPPEPKGTDSPSPPSASSSSPPSTPDEPHRTHRPWPHRDPHHKPPSRPQH